MPQKTNRNWLWNFQSDLQDLVSCVAFIVGENKFMPTLGRLELEGRTLILYCGTDSDINHIGGWFQIFLFIFTPKIGEDSGYFSNGFVQPPTTLWRLQQVFSKGNIYITYIFEPVPTFYFLRWVLQLFRVPRLIWKGNQSETSLIFAPFSWWHQRS